MNFYYYYLGAVYRYVKASDGRWTFASIMLGSGAADGIFGAGIDVFNGTDLMIGECREGVAGTGAVHVYVKTTIYAWSKTQILANSANNQGKLFGRGVAICGNAAFIGAPYDTITSNYEGNCYLFSSHLRTHA